MEIFPKYKRKKWEFFSSCPGFLEHHRLTLEWGKPANTHGTRSVSRFNGSRELLCLFTFSQTWKNFSNLRHLYFVISVFPSLFLCFQTRAKRVLPKCGNAKLDGVVQRKHKGTSALFLMEEFSLPRKYWDLNHFPWESWGLAFGGTGHTPPCPCTAIPPPSKIKPSPCGYWPVWRGGF